MLRRLCAVFFAASLLAANAHLARAADPSPEPSDSANELPHTKTSVTHHHVAIDGADVAYRATAELTRLVDKDGKPDAAMFSVAYEKEGAPHATRPVAFLWNGGPGSSTLWLHMGSFAPLRVATNGTNAIVPPGHLVPNDGTLLGDSDLVFVDARGPATVGSVAKRRRRITTASMRTRARSRNSSNAGSPRTIAGGRRNF